MDAKNPDVLVAGTWQVVMQTWAMHSGGPGSGVYNRPTRARPGSGSSIRDAKPPVGKIDVAIAPTNSNRVYALDPDVEPGIALALGRRRDVVEGRELGPNADRPRRLLHPRSRDPPRRGRGVRHEQQPAPIDRRRHDLPRAPRRLRRLSRHLDRSDERGPSRSMTGDNELGITTDTAARFRASSCRSARCITSPSTTGCRTGSTATGRMTGRCAAAAIRRSRCRTCRRAGAPSRRRVARWAAAAVLAARVPPPWDQGIGGCESGFTIPDHADPEIIWASCYGNKVTR